MFNYLKLIFIWILFVKCYGSVDPTTKDNNIQYSNNDNINIQKSTEGYIEIDIKPKQLLLFSTLTAITTAKNLIVELFTKNNVTTVLYIPYAHFSYNYSVATVSPYLEKYGYNIESIHTKHDPIEAVKNAQAIFIGGGNTFVLLKTLYDQKLIEPIREQILKNGIPFIGTSAGANVATRSIQTTNDMPIVYPPTFTALNLIPFNINPHYESDTLFPECVPIAEPRFYRIYRFLQFNNATVLGMRNGNILSVEGNDIKLLGTQNATLFQREFNVVDYEPGSDLSFLSQLQNSN